METKNAAVLKLPFSKLLRMQEVYGGFSLGIQRCVLYTIHLALACLHYLTLMWKKISTHKLQFIKSSSNVNRMIENAKQLNKSPKHLVVIINEDEISICEVVDLISWVVISGITCLTISDKQGFLQRNSSVIQQKYEEKLQEMYPSDHLHYPATQFHIDNGLNIADHQKVLHHVFLTSTSNGRQSFMECVKSLSCEMAHCENLKQSFNAKYLDERLRANCIGNVIEPDLALTIGPYLSYFGFQPWSMRLNEIISLPSLHKMTYAEFHEALITFARCEQRFGT